MHRVRERMAVAGLLAALAAPARAAGAIECLAAWRVGGGVADGAGLRVMCRDGAACDLDAAADGTCTIAVALCLGEAGCEAEAVGRVAVRGGGRQASALRDAVKALGTPAGGGACTASIRVRVALGRRRRRTTTLSTVVSTLGRTHVDRDRLRLTCERPGARAAARARAVVVTTDFETGLLATVGVARPHPVGHPETPIHSDAVVRVAGDRVYVVNRFLGDNLQVLDPARGLATVLQCSTGLGSNPHDVAVVAPRKAYVTRYDERALWIVDPAAGGCGSFLRGAIDLASHGDADGLPEMDQMALVGDRLFVSLARLDRGRRFAPTGPSALAVVDVVTDRVVGTVELAGANAFGDASGLVREPGTGKLVVASVGDFFRTGDGGLERVDPVALRSEGLFMTEREFGGNVTDFLLLSPTKGYAVVFVAGDPPRSTLVAFDPSRGAVVRRLFTSAYNLPDVALAPDGTLWLADQGLPSPGLRIFDPATDRQLVRGVIDVGLPPFSMAFFP